MVDVAVTADDGLDSGRPGGAAEGDLTWRAQPIWPPSAVGATAPTASRMVIMLGGTPGMAAVPGSAQRYSLAVGTN